MKVQEHLPALDIDGKTYIVAEIGFNLYDVQALPLEHSRLASVVRPVYAVLRQLHASFEDGIARNLLDHDKEYGLIGPPYLIGMGKE